jgi:DnaJ-class molecular chaperone
MASSKSAAAGTARDLYTVLAIHRNATQSEIKTAYRKIAQQLHPDKLHGQKIDPIKTSKFRAATDAYETLADQEKRQRYDRDTYGSRYMFTPSSGAAAGDKRDGSHGPGSAPGEGIHAQYRKVYRPMAPPSGSDGKIFNFEKWRHEHYGDTGINAGIVNKLKEGPAGGNGGKSSMQWGK